MRKTNVARSALFVPTVVFLALIAFGGISPAGANPQGTKIAEHFIDLLNSYDTAGAVYDSADYNSGSDVTTIYGFSLMNPKEDSTLTIQSIELAGVRLHANGAMSADEMIASKIYLEDRNDDTTVAVRQMTVQEPLFPDRASVEGKNGAFVYRLASEFLLEDIVIDSDNVLLPIGYIYAARGPLDGEIPETMEFDIGNIVLQIDDIDEADSREQFRKFGYDEIDFSFSSVWSWDSSAEQAIIGPVRLSIIDLGTATFDLSVGGVSRELLLTFEDEERALELAQLMSFISLHYAVEDDSITDRVINVMSTEADLSPSTLIGIWVDLSRQQMMGVGLPEDFIKMVLKATEFYLNNPGIISLAAEPEAPIPAAQLMGSVMFGPAAIIPMLNITVTAE